LCLKALVYPINDGAGDGRKALNPPKLGNAFMRYQASMLPHGMKNWNILRLKARVKGPIVTYVKSDFRDQDLLDRCRSRRLVNNSPEYSVHSCTYNGREITLVATGSGSAGMLSALWEVKSNDKGAIVRIGACGGLSGAKLNRVVVADSASCVDKVSQRLGRGKVSADSKLTSKIIDGFERRQIAFTRGQLASVEAMYLFESDVKRAWTSGALAWDLETATVLALGRKWNIPAASILLAVCSEDGRSMTRYPPIQRLDFVESVFEALTTS
jgi:uridine phosphorylase